MGGGGGSLNVNSNCLQVMRLLEGSSFMPTLGSCCSLSLKYSSPHTPGSSIYWSLGIEFSWHFLWKSFLNFSVLHSAWLSTKGHTLRGLTTVSYLICLPI